MFNNSDSDYDFGDDILDSSFRPAVDKIIVSEPASKRAKLTTRIFPGPAGLLSRDNQPLELTQTNSDLSHSESQLPSGFFNQNLWLKASKDYQNLPEKYTVKWIRNRSIAKELSNGKAPFLCAVIQNIECINLKNTLVTVTLRDQTGEIKGTLVEKLYEKYQQNLQVGSIIVIKNFGVLTTNSKNPHLTITSNNLMRIYSNIDDKMMIIEVQLVSNEDLLGKTNKSSENTDNNRLKLETECDLSSIFKNDDFVDLNFTDSDNRTKIDKNLTEEKLMESALEGLDADTFVDDF